MPCDQAQEVTVEFSEATDLNALALALEGLGLAAVRVEGKAVVFRGGVFSKGSFTLNAYETQNVFPTIERLKRAYTKATVLESGDRFGWTVTAKKALKLAGFSRQW